MVDASQIKRCRNFVGVAAAPHPRQISVVRENNWASHLITTPSRHPDKAHYSGRLWPSAVCLQPRCGACLNLPKPGNLDDQLARNPQSLCFFPHSLNGFGLVSNFLCHFCVFGIAKLIVTHGTSIGGETVERFGGRGGVTVAVKGNFLISDNKRTIFVANDDLAMANVVMKKGKRSALVDRASTSEEGLHVTFVARLKHGLLARESFHSAVLVKS